MSFEFLAVNFFIAAIIVYIVGFRDPIKVTCAFVVGLIPIVNLLLLVALVVSNTFYNTVVVVEDEEDDYVIVYDEED